MNFFKNNDDSYFELLRLAKVSDSVVYTSVNLNKAIYSLNEIKYYSKIHKRLLPLLNEKAKKLNVFNSLNKETQSLLKNEVNAGVVTELAMKAQLTKIINSFSANNIPILLLKGAAFSNVLYSNEAPRTSNDLDILIETKHWDEGVALLKELMTYTEKPQTDVFGDLYELSFIPSSNVGVAVDLHSSLIHPYLFNIDEKQLWESSVQHPSFNNSLVRMLCPEHTLIHQALHAYKDMNFAKYNLVDCYEIIESLKPNISKTVTIAKQWGASIPLYVLLSNCAQIMGTQIDEKNLYQLKPNLLFATCLKLLVNSSSSELTSNNKTIGYRLNQLLSQFFFTGSIKRPLSLQWLFLQSMVKN